MAKNLKINIKNTQIAKAISQGLAKKESEKKETKKESSELKSSPKSSEKVGKTTPLTAKKESPQSRHREDLPPLEDPSSPSGAQPSMRIKARSKSHFADPSSHHFAEASLQEAEPTEECIPLEDHEVQTTSDLENSREELSQEVPLAASEPIRPDSPKAVEKESSLKEPPAQIKKPEPRRSSIEPTVSTSLLSKRDTSFLKALPIREKFGPTGKHVKDLLPPPKPERPLVPRPNSAGGRPSDRFSGNRPYPPRPPGSAPGTAAGAQRGGPAKTEAKTSDTPAQTTEAPRKSTKYKEFKDVKPAKKQDSGKFDSRDRQGLRAEEDLRWRKKRSGRADAKEEDTTIRPSSLKIRLPIIIKDLAQEMKLKASQLIQKLFLQGVVVTLNDLLEDATAVQLLGHEFGCDIVIDTSQQERIRVTAKTVQQEIDDTDSSDLVKRPPVVAFMGHVDHGKTSLIDAIRKSNRAQGEAGAITQHIGAFMCSTPVGDLAILDTPGHEAFSEMRKRGANVTDIVVLVVAGDEGIRQQTIEAINHAKEAEVTIVVALNKCDKPNFNAENVYRQLADQNLLPEQWGGQTICISCSATTQEGIPTLLEMLALQADVLELRANTHIRARGRVIESEMHKGMGPKTTVLVLNGSLKKGDALVFEQHFGRVKTMHNDLGNDLDLAGPSYPVEITGLSGLPEAGQEFIVVSSEKEAREIVEIRVEEIKAKLAKKKVTSFEHILQEGQKGGKKVLNLVLRADVQGSLEAVKTALMKIESAKCDLNIIYAGVGEVSESDIQLANASKAMILGFHTQVESHADDLIKVFGVQVKLHNIIYHAIDEVKASMQSLLDKIPIEKEMGKAEVRATFKSSQLGIIAGCQVIEGVIQRSNFVRVKRKGEQVFKGSISSLKKVKEDVREIAKGQECGIVLTGFSECEVGDIIEAYEVQYLTQDL